MNTIIIDFNNWTDFSGIHFHRLTLIFFTIMILLIEISYPNESAKITVINDMHIDLHINKLYDQSRILGKIVVFS